MTRQQEHLYLTISLQSPGPPLHYVAMDVRQRFHGIDACSRGTLCVGPVCQSLSLMSWNIDEDMQYLKKMLTFFQWYSLLAHVLFIKTDHFYYVNETKQATPEKSLFYNCTLTYIFTVMDSLFITPHKLLYSMAFLGFSLKRFWYWFSDRCVNCCFVSAPGYFYSLRLHSASSSLVSDLTFDTWPSEVSGIHNKD